MKDESKSEKQQLIEKLNELIQKQNDFRQEINDLRRQIISLKEGKAVHSENLVAEKKVEEEKQYERRWAEKTAPTKPAKKKKRTISDGIGSELEQFIGTNLINKIGMLVVIIGVGIGVKYAIDNNLISPLVRIILGYLLGIGLAAFAIRLKPKYLNFSAVLFSGAMAIHYFITYAAHTYYNLFPQNLAIALMIVLTVLTVLLALYYKQQVIAHYGLVGAYIIPFILNEPFENVTNLFIYMVIINSGILFLSTKKKWKPLNYLAFVATWVIFITWYAMQYNESQWISGLVFLTLFFVIFYLVFLSYKILLKEKFRLDDIFFFLINAGIFFILGYNLLETNESTKEFLGLFTMVNAAFHGITSFIIFRNVQSNNKLFYWSIGLTILFVTTAVAIQFNDQITVILWSVGTAFLFLYARSRRIIVFEIFSYVLIGLTTFALMANWGDTSYSFYKDQINRVFLPVLNLPFLASTVAIVALVFIYYVNNHSKTTDIEQPSKSSFADVIVPLLLLFVVFFSIFTQISLYWNNQQIYASYELASDAIWYKQFDKLNQDIGYFMAVWLINYTVIFVTLLNFANSRWFRSKNLGALLMAANYTLIILFLAAGLNTLSSLLDSYLADELPLNYNVSFNHIAIRYISLAFFALLMFSNYRFLNTLLKTEALNKIFEVVLCITIVWVGSSELINWLKLSGAAEVDKYGLSILWGVFSLAFIVFGIWKKKKHIRFTSMVLIGVTLLKLFFYDLTNLKTIPKTIVFLSIGILFLIISYLYNKYRMVIFP